eukprot:TRINITY_DN25005_c0_g1_i1.p1 TRINITY_DN25005_c0_g1~~TRINITY_DN25005_c0_g1_i1.p1  ORF type:complete len:669 (+),score=181.34 TRINITY_DN25005_c0_g1_i1:53-2008(+)
MVSGRAEAPGANQRRAAAGCCATTAALFACSLFSGVLLPGTGIDDDVRTVQPSEPRTPQPAPDTPRPAQPEPTPRPPPKEDVQEPLSPAPETDPRPDEPEDADDPWEIMPGATLQRPVPSANAGVARGADRGGKRGGTGGYMEWLGDPGGWNGTCPYRTSPAWKDLRIRWSMQPKQVKQTVAPEPIPDSVKVPWHESQRYEVPSRWISDIAHAGRQWYHITNFCVRQGRLVLFDGRLRKTKHKRFHLYHEFSRTKNMLRYTKEPVPHRLEGPLVDWPAWILTFWCQDLFHTTLTMMPAHSIKRWNNSDIYIKIATKSPCHVKLGSNHSWQDGYNPMFKDRQFGGSKTYPFWPLYQALTDHPARVRPLGPHSLYNNGTVCYREGLVDKKWFILPNRREAIAYADAHIRNLGVRRRQRRCRKEGGYRLTLINRQSQTRRFGNLQEVAEAARCFGFDVAIVAFENLNLREQIEIAANTDCLLGMHGNALIWTKFQERGAFEIEVMGAWYERYSKLFGGGYNHTKMHDKWGVKGDEWQPFFPNMTQVTQALRSAKEHLDRTSCGESPELPSLSVSHMDVWKEIMIRLHPELANPPGRRGQKPRVTPAPEAAGQREAGHASSGEDDTAHVLAGLEGGGHSGGAGSKTGSGEDDGSG